jgi:hypothetical protein
MGTQERGRGRCETAPKQRGKKLRAIIPRSVNAVGPEWLSREASITI